MSKWSRLKVAMLATTATMASLQLAGCLGNNWWQRVVQYTVIGNLFD